MTSQVAVSLSVYVRDFKQYKFFQTLDILFSLDPICDMLLPTSVFALMHVDCINHHLPRQARQNLCPQQCSAPYNHELPYSTSQACDRSPFPINVTHRPERTSSHSQIHERGGHHSVPCQTCCPPKETYWLFLLCRVYLFSPLIAALVRPLLCQVVL